MGRYVGQVEDIIKDYDVFTHDGFEHAMREAKHVPEGEAHHLAACSPSGGYENRFRKHQLGRSEITWTTMVLKLPDDGTGALPLLRHVILNDAKFSNLCNNAYISHPLHLRH